MNMDPDDIQKHKLTRKNYIGSTTHSRTQSCFHDFFFGPFRVFRCLKRIPPLPAFPT